mmetsp:Transcript_42861/g.48701  ORF Transcript_42861/g.48701 Transcript_42861/m.48701 type:complete len:97 (+) Transcript_42861:107-397(+)
MMSGDNITSTDVEKDFLERKCIEELEAEHVDATVLGGGCDGGAKVDIIVVSKKFEKLPLLKRHRMVNDLFCEELADNKIHSLTIKAWTPTQFKNKS